MHANSWESTKGSVRDARGVAYGNLLLVYIHKKAKTTTTAYTYRKSIAREKIQQHNLNSNNKHYYQNQLTTLVISNKYFPSFSCKSRFPDSAFPVIA